MKNNSLNVLTRRDLLAGLATGAASIAAFDVASADTRVADASSKSSSHALDPVLKIARGSLAKLESVDDYSATFYKDVVVRGRRIKYKLSMKVREKPFSVYLKWESPYEGREVIYVDGKNNGKLVFHGTGLEAIVGTLYLDPKGSKAMEENRYDITLIGLRNMTQELIKQWESDLKFDDISVKFYPNARVGTTQCKVVQTVHKTKKKGVEFHMSRLYVDRKTGYPVRVEQFGFPKKSGAQPPMLEQYTYLDVKPNNKFKDIDFSKDNPKYGY